VPPFQPFTFILQISAAEGILISKRVSKGQEAVKLHIENLHNSQFSQTCTTGGGDGKWKRFGGETGQGGICKI
jgi:hypothetical protein